MSEPIICFFCFMTGDDSVAKGCLIFPILLITGFIIPVSLFDMVLCCDQYADLYPTEHPMSLNYWYI